MMRREKLCRKGIEDKDITMRSNIDSQQIVELLKR
jgi:hypothetical protein